jgi:hypothetical protein
MTASQLARVLLRRWYVLVVLGVLVVLAVGLIPKTRGVYTAQTNIVFLPPSNSNRLQDQTASSVQFAAIVERQFNGNRGNSPIALQSATLYGEGVRQGYTVTLHNDGGQWTNNFDKPDLSVEVVGSSPGQVASVVRSVTARVEKLAETIQIDENVAAAERIGTIQSPAVPQVTYIAASTTRAAVASLALGFIASLLLTVLLDRILERWSRYSGASTRHLKRLVRERARQA